MIHRLRALVLVRHALERYADFGPALLTEELAKEGVKVDHDTVRRWLLAGGKLTARWRKQPHRPWRERKPCFGATVPLNGSHHDWLEGRRAECVRRVMVGDATNRMRARFSEEETTRASAPKLVRGSGLPLSLRRGGERGGATSQERTANTVWPDDGGMGSGTDPGQ